MIRVSGQPGQGINHRPVGRVVRAERQALQEQWQHAAVVITVRAAQAGMDIAPVQGALGVVFLD